MSEVDELLTTDLVLRRAIAISTPGASRRATLVYSSGRSPVSFSGAAQTVGGSDKVGWSWHMESKSSVWIFSDGSPMIACIVCILLALLTLALATRT